MSYIPQASSPSDDILALLPDEDTVRRLLIQVREKAFYEGIASQRRYHDSQLREAYRDGLRAGVERDSAATYGAGYDSGYQDGVRATRQAGP